MSQYIEGYCRSNDDDLARYEWPTVFVSVPNVGDRVESVELGRRASVCSITHKQRLSGGIAVPYIEVELQPIRFGKY